jgi:hypothetical protein
LPYCSFLQESFDTETELRNKFHRDAKCCRIFQKKTVVKWESAVSCREDFHCHHVTQCASGITCHDTVQTLSLSVPIEREIMYLRGVYLTTHSLQEGCSFGAESNSYGLATYLRSSPWRARGGGAATLGSPGPGAGRRTPPPWRRPWAPAAAAGARGARGRRGRWRVRRARRRRR